MDRKRIVRATLIVACGLPACGKSAESEQKTIAEALSHVSDVQDKAKVEEGMKKLKEKAAADAAKAREDAFAAAIVVPASLPASLDTACTQANDALDRFMQGRLQANADELQRWNVMKATDLEKAKQTCMGTNVQVAACQAHAFDNAPVLLTQTDATEVADRCLQRFGQAADPSELRAAAR